MTPRMLHKAACHPHKSENLVHAYWRYHSVERCTMRIKEVQEQTLGVYRTAEHHPLIFTNWERSPKYDRNHSNALPPIPNRPERRDSIIRYSDPQYQMPRKDQGAAKSLMFSDLRQLRYHYGHGLKQSHCCEVSCEVSYLVVVWVLSVSFQSFVLCHLVIAHVGNSPRN